jgi:hypothetical protein
MRMKCLVGSNGRDSFPGLVLDRALYELEKGDWTMGILLSAIAVETVPSVFASHWNPPLVLPTDVIPRISKICKELHPPGLERFVGTEMRVNKWMTYDFRDDVLKLFGRPKALVSKIYDAVFVPRNAIVHEGKFDYSRDEAFKAWNVAVFFYRVVRAMEVWKSHEIDPESLDSMFRKVEEEFPASPAKSTS